ncbi:M3 family oligoendopeptidase [Bacillus sp. M6-12]|uniref:M3 family oligoendopeptidase n=1 Tax=Bacillus sp. M6-12 TaxID=2054166 RepID=UPI000C75AE8F|nr:M3 family oligoendopeptidase [Bacillus sp. M6-12]PLS17263.1 M3 family oligoendopeptidase [Bacillus sp. M6-12]
MKSKNYPYQRPDLDEIAARISDALQEFNQSSTAKAQGEAIKEINGIRNHVETMMQICIIRHTGDTANEFYKKEQDYWDEAAPLFAGMVTDYYKTLLASGFRSELEQLFGAHLFALAETKLKTFSADVIEDLQQENKLVSEYTQLEASSNIFFDGKERTISQIYPYTLSADRNIRKEASEARFSFYQEHKEQLDDIYDKLVKIRTVIARKLGFENFTELAYARLGRTDYGAEMVASFRQQVKEHAVPLATRLKKRQQVRLGLDELKYFDDEIMFSSGNPVPKGSSEWIVEQGKKMYQELSAETGEFIQHMLDRELMDLTAKAGKAGGGYCTYLPEFQSPFIFANFNGSADDIRVLTHEAGHAFQVYQSRNLGQPEYYWPTYEASEIHSMSMEYLTWPWMENFFKEEADKYLFAHLNRSVFFLPYGCAVDEFQHAVYENPDWSPSERKTAWKDIEKAYLPYLDFDGNEYLESGGYWQRQIHIYTDPFYFIDYALAQICAMQFWKRSREDQENAWRDYMLLCKLGGSKSFTELMKLVNLDSPFEEGSIASVLREVDGWLEAVEDNKICTGGVVIWRSFLMLEAWIFM